MAKHLTVPQRAFDVLRAVGRAPQSSHESLSTAISASEPFSSPDGLISVIREAFGGGLTGEQAKSLVAEVFSMTHLIVGHDYSSETAATDVAQFPDLELENDERSRLGDTIELLLQADAVRGLSAGAAVFGAQDHLFTGADVFVDARPVFYPGVDHSLGMIMTRRVRLEYIEDGDYKGLELSLTETEYDSLIDSLEKGRREAVATEELLTASQIAVFKFDDTEEEDAE